MLSISSNIKLDLPIQYGCKELELLPVESGSFTMGYSPDSNLHLSDRSFEMTLSNDFWLGKYLITQTQWQAIMGNNPSKFIGNDLPVENVCWYEARLFCDKLNALHSHLLPDGYQFDLPTEAQWEYACKAHAKTRNYKGDSVEDVPKIAWCLENSNDRTHEVGQKEPNLFGFYDMFGNVFEWCFDMIVDYPKHQAVDWVGIDNNEYLGVKGVGSRVIRGGSYFSPSDSDSFDAATRSYVGEDTKDNWYGFRLCLAPVKLLES
jgi:formylglycine-generating enzyme required for sulfatase activity